MNTYVSDWIVVFTSRLYKRTLLKIFRLFKCIYMLLTKLDVKIAGQSFVIVSPQKNDREVSICKDANDTFFQVLSSWYASCLVLATRNACLLDPATVRDRIPMLLVTAVALASIKHV